MFSTQLAPIFNRLERAHAGFVELLRERAGLTEAQAIAVKNVYLKERCAKVDAGIHRITVKHGGLLDKEVILRALAYANEKAARAAQRRETAQMRRQK